MDVFLGDKVQIFPKCGPGHCASGLELGVSGREEIDRV